MNNFLTECTPTSAPLRAKTVGSSLSQTSLQRRLSHAVTSKTLFLPSCLSPPDRPPPLAAPLQALPLLRGPCRPPCSWPVPVRTLLGSPFPRSTACVPGAFAGRPEQRPPRPTQPRRPGPGQRAPRGAALCAHSRVYSRSPNSLSPRCPTSYPRARWGSPAIGNSWFEKLLY